MHRYKKGSLIAQGAYGDVYNGTLIANGSPVAMKSARINSSTQEGIPTTTLREISVLRDLEHPNIIGLLDVVSDLSDGKLWLVFERMAMDLRKFMVTQPDINFDIQKSLMLQCLSGVEFFHRRAIMHRDIKPQNLLVSGTSDHFVLKVADFGLARTLSSCISCADYTNEVVTRWYRSPEILLGAINYSTGVDIWSLAVVFMELLDTEHEPLLCGKCEIEQLHMIFKLRGLPNAGNWPEACSLPYFRDTFPNWTGQSLIRSITVAEENARKVEEAVNVCDSMMALNPAMRPNATTCIVQFGIIA